MRSLLVVGLLSTLAFAGCLDDEPIAQEPEVMAPPIMASHAMYGFQTTVDLPIGDGSTITEVVDGQRVWYNPPVWTHPPVLQEMQPEINVEGVPAGHGIAVFGSLVITGQQAGPMYIVDISNPEAPQLIGESADSPVRDADTILYPDGRLVVISSSGGAAISATDITNPAQPTLIGQFETSGGNHNIAVVPGTPIVYNSAMDIVDFSDPSSPVELGNWGGDGCHDIAFYMNPETSMYRAYCAGYANSEIWDLADPRSPQLIIEIPFPGLGGSMPGAVGSTLHDAGADDVPVVSGAHPGFSHLAIVNHDASILIVGDETGGGAVNACDFYLDAGESGTYSGPIGNLYFYDITEETNPIFKGHVSPSYPDAANVPSPNDNDPLPDACTAHFGKIIGDTGFLVMAFYGAGLVLVDFRDIENPRITDMLDQGGEVWDVWVHQGRLYTGDMERGLDIVNLA